MCLDIAKKHPSIHTYSTLSPIPGYGTWLRKIIAESKKSSSDVMYDKISRIIAQFPSDINISELKKVVAADESDSLHNVLLRTVKLIAADPHGCSTTWLKDFQHLRSNPHFAAVSDFLVLYYLTQDTLPARNCASLPLGES